MQISPEVVGIAKSWGVFGQQGEPSYCGVLGRGICVRSDPNIISITASSRADKYLSNKQWDSLEPTLLTAKLKELYKDLTFRKVQLCLIFIWQFYLHMERPDLSSVAALKSLWLQEALSEWVLLSPTVFLGARVSAGLGSPRGLRLLKPTANSLQRWVEIFRF